MGMVVVLTSDLFICATGSQVTLRKETGLVYNEYDEINEAGSTYTDTSIKVLFEPEWQKVMRRTEPGLEQDRNEIVATFQSDCTVEEGDLIVDGNDIYRVIQLSKRTYQGMIILQGRLRRERQ